VSDKHLEDGTRFGRRWRLLIVANAVVLAAACLAGALLLRHQIARVVVPVLRRESPLRNPLILLHSGLPVYEIRISQPRLRKLVALTNRAKERFILTDDLKVWFPAKFIHEGRIYQCKVRIRGDQWHHWRGGQQSWRVKFKKGHYFKGRRNINLILPSTRAYIGEHMAMLTARRLGLMTPRDGFAVLRINGTVPSLYYEVEHFGDEMLAHQARAETPILAAYDRWLDSIWYVPNGSVGVADDRSRIGEIREVRSYSNDPGQNARAMAAFEQVVLALRDPSDAGLEKALQLLDAEKFARLYALLPIMGSTHVTLMRSNMRLYYDASRGLFEPIVWDVRLYPLEDVSLDHGRNPVMRARTIDYYLDQPMPDFRRRFLSVDRYQHLRNTLLWDLVEDDGKWLLETIKALNDKYYPLFRADGNLREDWRDELKPTLDAMPYNVGRVRRVLRFTRAMMTVRLGRDPNVAKLVITPDQFSALEFQGLVIRPAPGSQPGQTLVMHDEDGDGRLTDSDPIFARGRSEDKDKVLRLLGEPVLLHSGRKYNPRGPYSLYPVPREHVFFVRTERPVARALLMDPERIEIVARNAVTGDALPRHHQLINAVDDGQVFDLAAGIRSRAAFLRACPQFRPEPDRGDAVVLPAGEHQIKQTVIVPGGLTLIIRPGCTLRMGPGVSIYCFGPIRAGEKGKAPVKILPADDKTPWGVVASVRSKAQSTFYNVATRLSSEARVNGVYCSGGLAVHLGDAVFEGCTIEQAQGDDGLNVKDGAVTVRDCVFLKNSSDGIDLDVCKGVVEDCRFEDNGGDGVDLSWSTVTIRRNLLARCGDKGISVGEKSSPLIHDNIIRGCVYGVAVKDLSRVRILFTTFAENRMALGLYQKKPVFGGGRAEVANCVFLRDKEVAKLDEQSTLTLTGCVGDGVPETAGLIRSALRVLDLGRNDLRLDKGSLPKDYRLDHELPNAASVDVAPDDMPGVRAALIR